MAPDYKDYSENEDLNVVNGPDLRGIWDEIPDVETEDAAIDIMDDPAANETDKLMNLDSLVTSAKQPSSLANFVTQGGASTANTDAELQAIYGGDGYGVNEDPEGIVEETPEGMIHVQVENKGPVAPTLENYQKYQAQDALKNSSQPYPEDTDPNLTKALNSSNPVAEKFRQLGKMQPEERAKTGAAFGAVTGTQFMGKEGAVIGGALGAMIGRGAGIAQSGEQAKINRDNRIWNSMKTLGAVAPDGKVKFDNSEVDMPPEATGRLKNLRTDTLTGARDRSLYELDPTNPLTQCATLVGKPLGLYLSQAMLGYRDSKDPVASGAPSAATNMFANTFSKDVDNREAIYARGRQMVKKLGLNRKAMEGYFTTLGPQISIQEAEDIKKGLDILFAEETPKKRDNFTNAPDGLYYTNAKDPGAKEEKHKDMFFKFQDKVLQTPGPVYYNKK